jgi:hypothetical protein
MKPLRRLLAASVLVVHLSGCAADGSVCGEGKDCDPEKTALLVLGGVALAGVAILAAGSCKSDACQKGFFDALSGNKNPTGVSDDENLTGGPDYDWDRFSNGQYRCRDIHNGQYAANYHCAGMPKDDDRWP